DLVPGVRIIPTPGHTEGHISIYLEESATLIAGDLVVIEDGKLDLAYPQFAQSLKRCLESIERTRKLAIERVLCYHGGWLAGDYQVQAADILRKYGANL
ncbi:MAG TPA: MBL fold metallo-hydrolase, partial [Aggregatilineaceae bacterium]|nr:MBL fold metallo-hydrolase [Aggregatilineaceae bacterium]